MPGDCGRRFLIERDPKPGQTTRMFLPAGPSNPILFLLGWLTRQFICLQIQKYRIELDSPPLSLVGSTNRKMMLTIFSNKLDFHGAVSKLQSQQWILVGRIHADKLREKSAMFPLVVGGCGFISEFGHRSRSSGTR